MVCTCVGVSGWLEGVHISVGFLRAGGVGDDCCKYLWKPADSAPAFVCLDVSDMLFVPGIMACLVKEW